MATCPKCGEKLKLTDWKQECPHCNTNLMFYGFEERFINDAKRAEMGNARVRMFIAHLKAAFIGGPLQCARIGLSFLPLILLLIPFGTFTINVLMFHEEIPLNLIGLYKLISSGGFDLVRTLSESDIVGVAMKSFMLNIYMFISIALIAVIIIVLEILSFIGARAVTVLMTVFSGLGVVFCAFESYAARRLIVAAETNAFFNADSNWGCFAVRLAFLAFFLVNMLLLKKGIKVQYRSGDPYRRTMAKKVKKGLVNIEDLPFPIFETEEEKAARLALEEKTAEEIERASQTEPEDETPKEEARVNE